MSFLMLKAEPEPFDLIKIQQSNGRVIHSFLNVEWAIIADVDLESEKYRYLGSMRFLLGLIKRIICS